MKLLERLFRTAPDPREELRPLWHRLVAISREPQWYADCGVADSVPGHFDMITAVLSLVLLRLERDDDCAPAAPAGALLAELFVEDMDGQLRESGVGDIVVGKHIGKLMSALGGRLGAYRSALAGEASLEDAARRNVTLIEGASPAALAARLRALADELEAMPTADVLAGRIER